MDDFKTGFDSAFEGFGGKAHKASDILNNGMGNDSDAEFTNMIVGIAHSMAGFLLVWGIRKMCCKTRAPPAVGPEGPTAEVEQLQPKKRLFSAYSLLFSGGIVGAHHFYLERLVHGLLASWSCNFLFIGWLVDLFMMPSYVRAFNSKRTDPSAPHDGSKRTLACKLPLMSVTVVAALILIGMGTPWFLHRVGLVDIDRLAAQTEINPYDLLELSRGASLAEAKTAYRKHSLKWHPDRNQGCGKECDDKMSEITKAFDLIKKRRAPTAPDKTYEDRLKDIGRDWWYVFEVLGSKYKQDEAAKKAPEKKQRL